MTTVRVPHRAVPTMELLARLSTPRRQEVLSVLTSPTPILSLSDLYAQLDAVVGKVSDTHVASDEIGRELFSLAGTVRGHGYDVAKTTQEIAESPQLHLTKPQRRALAALLASALDSPAIKGLGKAVDLVSEQDKLLHAVRILTDVRPVFDAADETPIGAVITHRLRLEAFSDTGVETVEVSLTTENLDSVIEAATRAVAKAGSLQRLLDSSNLSVYNLDDPE